MNKYLVFHGTSYYPNGGWNDFVGCYESLDDAISVCNILIGDSNSEWAQIVDVETFSLVKLVGNNELA